MSWGGFLMIGLLAVLPVWIGRHKARLRIDTRTAALALYRGQLAELARDHTVGLVTTEDYGHAQREIQRRLLVADGLARLQPPTSAPAPASVSVPASGPRQRLWRSDAWIALALVALATALYGVNGHPLLPSHPSFGRATVPDTHTLAILRTLQVNVATFPKDSPSYRPGHTLLGQAEQDAGLLDAAIHDWQAALAKDFSPELAIRLAELLARRNGRITDQALSLYRQALAVAPAEAPWRLAVEARIAEGEHERGEH